MSSFELLALLALSAAVWYWFDGMRAREIALMTGARVCKAQGVYFLDESVALTRLRLRRNTAGQVVFYREYRFEFTSDGAHRYRGKLCLMGKQVVSTVMEPYRQNVDDDYQ